MASKQPLRRSRSSRMNPLGVVQVPKYRQQNLPKSSLEVGRRTKLVQKRDTWFRRTPLGKFMSRFQRKPLLPGQKRRFTWKTALYIAGGIFAVLTLATAGLFAYYVRDLPNPKELTNRKIDQSTKILDRNGKLIYSFYGDENRTILKPDDISQYMKQAAVATEDARFFEHHGFDARGLARAVFCQLPLPFCSGRVAGGGSTITQQYVRNADLVDRNQTFSRKIRELIASIEVEQIYSKEEILTGYLNQIPFGGSIYGVEAAAQSYFGKKAKDLTISESAILAAIIQRPGRLSPYGSHLDELFARKDFVLDRMAATGAITQAEADAAKADTPNADNPNFSKDQRLLAPHFVFFVRQKLLETMDADPTQAEVKLDQAGYTVYTSLDLDTQALAESVLKDMGPATVKKWQASNAAMTAMDPKTGEILAMVGSISYGDSKSGNTNFAAALLQPGSSIKPLVYATAFNRDNKKSPASVTFDLQTDFGGGYVPQNYNGQFRGPVINRNALAQSLNIPAVKNLGMIGLNGFLDTAKLLGITSFTKPSDYGLSIALGGAEVRQYELLSAYSTFENNGVHNDAKPILRIEKDGKIIRDFTTDKGTQVIEPQVAYQITSIISDNNARTPVFGARNNLTLPDRPVAAKSGTTNSNRDAWTVGYTPQIAVAVWVGNNEANKTMVKGADGSIVAAPIWKKFMTEYLTGKPVEQFVRPDGLTDFTVDMLSGKKPTDQSPPDERVTDIFAEWQIPTEDDDVHTKVRINKLTGKVATELTPADLIEDRYYIKVKSEKPSNPNWEGPVQAWAASKGYNGEIPTEKDDLYTNENRPTISFTSPVAGSTVSAPFTASVNVGGTRSIMAVDYSINGVVIGSTTSSPWAITIDPATLGTGTQIITATAKNDLGLTATAQVSVVVGTAGTTADKTPPGPVTGATGIKGTTPRSVRLAWTNPSDSDFAKVFVYQSSSSGSLGTKVQTVPGTPGTSSSVEMVNLPIGLLYFTMHTIDESGNESTQNVTVSVTVLP